LIEADKLFFDILSNGMDKNAILEQKTIEALGIKQPELLEQLEQQAGGTSEEASDQQAPVEEAPVEEAPVEEAPVEEAPVEEVDPRQVDGAEVKPRQEEVELEIPAYFFKGTAAHPLAILTILKHKYKDNWVHWLPETLWTSIRKDFGPVSEVNQNKIQALSVALSTDAPWQNWTVFENCGCAFNDRIPVFGQMQPLSPAETAYTVTILKRLHDFVFSDSSLGYIAAVCLYNGIVFAPKEWFVNAQMLIDRQNKQPELRDKVMRAWKRVQKKNLMDVEMKDTKVVDVHVAKLWAIQEYLKEKQSRLKEA
jgi:hypothetical protein